MIIDKNDRKLLDDKRVIIGLLSVAILIGTLYTWLNYIFPGARNLAEDLPQLFRMMNPDYLPNDHFVNTSTASFSIRTIYLSLLKIIFQIIDLHAGLFIGTLAFNVLTLFTVGYFSYRLSNQNAIAGVIAIFLSYQAIFKVAEGYLLLGEELVANFPNMLLIYLAFYWALIRQNLIPAGFILGIAALIQPINVMIAFTFCVFGKLINDLFSTTFTIQQLKTWRFWRPYIISSMLIGIFIIPVLLAYLSVSAGGLTDKEFIFIYGYVRVPHHAVFSYFMNQTKFLNLLLYGLMFLAIVFTSTTLKNNLYAKRFLIGTAILSIIYMIASYIFVEVIPTRIFVTLVPIMKISPILLWFGTILIACFISESDFNKYKLVTYILIVSYVLTTSHPVALFITALIIVRLIANFMPTSYNIQKLYPIAVMICGIVYFSSYVFQISPSNIKLNRQFHNLQLRVNANLEVRETPIYNYINDNIPEDALFIIPDLMFTFRLKTSRPLVVVFKTYPANDQGLAEWFERIQDVYTCTEGQVQGIPLDTPPRFRSLYSKIDDACLAYLHDKYQAPYAVLYSATPTQYPVLYTDAQYKLIDLMNHE